MMIRTPPGQSSGNAPHVNASDSSETPQNADIQDVRRSARIQRTPVQNPEKTPSAFPGSSSKSRSKKSLQTQVQTVQSKLKNTERETEKASFVTMDQFDMDTTETPRTNIEAFMTVAETEERVLRSIKRTPQNPSKKADKDLSFKAPKIAQDVLKKRVSHLFRGNVASPGGSKYTPRTNIWNLLNIDTDAELTPIERNVDQSRLHSTRSRSSISKLGDWGQEVTLSPMHVSETRDESSTLPQSFKKPKRRSFHIPAPQQSSDSGDQTTGNTTTEDETGPEAENEPEEVNTPEEEADSQKKQSGNSSSDNITDPDSQPKNSITDNVAGPDSVDGSISGLGEDIAVSEDNVENQKEREEVGSSLNESAGPTLLYKTGETGVNKDDDVESNIEFDDLRTEADELAQWETNIEGLIESLYTEVAEEEMEAERQRNKQTENESEKSLHNNKSSYSVPGVRDRLATSLDPKIVPSNQSELPEVSSEIKQKQAPTLDISKSIGLNINTSPTRSINQGPGAVTPNKSVYDMSEGSSSSEDSLSDFQTRISESNSSQKKRKRNVSGTPVSKSSNRSMSRSRSRDESTPSKTGKREASVALTNSGSKRSRLSFNEWKLLQQGKGDAISNLSKSMLRGPRSSTPSDRSKRFFHSTWRQSAIGQYLGQDEGPMETSTVDPITGISPIRREAHTLRDKGTEEGGSFQHHESDMPQMDTSKYQQKSVVDPEMSDELPSGLSPLSTPRIDLRKRLPESTIKKSVRQIHLSGGDAVGQSKAPEKNQAEKPAQTKTTRRKRKAPATALPRRSVKFFAERHCTLKLSKDAVEDIEKASEVFWDNSFKALEAYALHAGRKIINEEDVILMMKKQRVIKNTGELHDYIREYLPLELRAELIPMAKP